MASREKKPVHKVQMTEGKRNIIHQLLQEYDIQTAEDIQEALKDLLGGTIKEMMEAEAFFLMRQIRSCHRLKTGKNGRLQRFIRCSTSTPFIILSEITASSANLLPMSFSESIRMVRKKSSPFRWVTTRVLNTGCQF